MVPCVCSSYQGPTVPCITSWGPVPHFSESCIFFFKPCQCDSRFQMRNFMLLSSPDLFTVIVLFVLTMRTVILHFVFSLIFSSGWNNWEICMEWIKKESQKIMKQSVFSNNHLTKAYILPKSFETPP